MYHHQTETVYFWSEERLKFFCKSITCRGGPINVWQESRDKNTSGLPYYRKMVEKKDTKTTAVLYICCETDVG